MTLYDSADLPAEAFKGGIKASENPLDTTYSVHILDQLGILNRIHTGR